MNNRILKILGIFTLYFMLMTKPNALEIDIQDGINLTDNIVVTSYNSSDIYIENKKIEIENFETIVNGKNVYRKYVSLDDLVQNVPTISYKTNADSNIISVNRKYDKKINDFDVYYDTEHDISKRTFTSVLFVGEDDKILFGDSTRGDVLTADAETLTINDKIYVSLRFVTEALGAEVIHKVYDEFSIEEDSKKEKVTVNFYNSKNYGKIINLDWTSDNGSNVTTENINDASNGSCFTPNFSYKYYEEGKSVLKEVNNTYVKIYPDKNSFSWNINDKKICSTNDTSKSLENIPVVIKYRGVPVIVDVDNLGISKYCGIDNLTLEENCDVMDCDNNPRCGIFQGEYYCCNGF